MFIFMEITTNTFEPQGGDYPTLFKMLWEFGLSLVRIMDDLWQFLSTSITINFDTGLGGLLFGAMASSIFGDTSITFSPILIFSGSALMALLVAYLIKTFTPGA